MTQASIGTAIGSILGAISKVATATGDVVGDVASSADMLGNFINLQKEQQADRHILARRTYRSNLIAQHNAEITATQIALDEKFAANPQYKEMYLKNQAELEALFSSSESK